MIERLHEVLSGPLTEHYVRERAQDGWRLVAVEWERESPGEGVRRGWREEVPYGLRVAEDCMHLEENPTEREVLELMLDFIAMDRTLSQVAEELNRQGYGTRHGPKWTQEAVFNMLPRLIEAAPQIRRVKRTPLRK